MGLIEVSVVGSQGRRRAGRNALHRMERRLKPDDICIRLRTIADPVTHQTVQVTCAHATPRGHIRGADTPVRVLDIVKRFGHDAVDAGIGKALYEKSLQHLDAPFGVVGGRSGLATRSRNGASSLSETRRPTMRMQREFGSGGRRRLRAAVCRPALRPM